MPIPDKEKSNMRKALDVITEAGQTFPPLDSELDYNAKLIQEAINALHNKLDKIYNDKV